MARGEHTARLSGPGVGRPAARLLLLGLAVVVVAALGVLTALMWLGRLEIIPVAVLLTRAYWRP